MQALTLSWVGGEHGFALPLGALRTIQTVTNAGPQQVLARLLDGTWRVDDLLAVLQQGLIGGGMDRAEAVALVLSMAEVNGLRTLVMTAFGVLSAALSGVRDDTVGEPEGETPPPENGVGAAFTVQVPQPGSRLWTSTP